MSKNLRIVLAELVCLTFICTQIFSPLILSAEELGQSTEIFEGISTEDSGDQGNPIPEEESPENIEEASTQTGILDTQTEEISGSGDTILVESTETSTGDVMPTSPQEENTQAGDTPPVVPTELPVLVESSNIPREQEYSSLKEEDTPEILIQFKEDDIQVDSFFGKYQIQMIEDEHDIAMSDTLADENIVVMQVGTEESIEAVISPAEAFVVELQSDAKIESLIDEIRLDPRVEHVQRNFKYEIQMYVPQMKDSPEKKLMPTIFTGRSVPNDVGFSNLWGLDNQGQSVDGYTGTIDADIDYPEAMAYASGRLSSTGGVIVAVLDTGIYPLHPDLVPQFWNGSNCLSDTGVLLGGCQTGYDFVDDDRDPFDQSILGSSFFSAAGHGTHVAGTIGAVASNGSGIVGVAQNIDIMNVRICGESGCYTDDIIRGINFAQYNGAKVINASLGRIYSMSRESDFDLLSYQAIENFDGIFVAAAGNNATNTDKDKFLPAGFGSDTIVSGEYTHSGVTILSGEVTFTGLTNVIAVAATDQDDDLASFSNYGTGSVHIAAPGTSIYSTYGSSTISGITIDTASGGWIKSPNSTGSNWTTTSGEWILADMGSPYATGKTIYIERLFTNSGTNDYSFNFINIWCSTPTNSGTYNDYLSIDFSTGSTFATLKNIDEYTLRSESFFGELDTVVDGKIGHTSYVHIPPFQVSTPSFTLRFSWHSDGVSDGPQYGGCGLGIESATFDIVTMDRGVIGEYRYLDGTSMASPHVAGAVALAWNFRPEATRDEIRNAVLYSGDFLSSLYEKLWIPNRLNLLSMLRALEKPKILSQKLTVSGESGAKIEVTLDTDDMYTTVWMYDNTGTLSSSMYADAADILAHEGVITKQSHEKYYNLNDFVTRAEIAEVAAKIGGYMPTNCTGTGFSDVSNTLGVACGYIESLKDGGILSGSSAGIYRPNDYVTRAEMAKILTKSIGLTPYSTGSFLDLESLSPDLISFIYRLQMENCVYHDYGTKIFYPYFHPTRQEIYQTAVCLNSLTLGTGSKSERYFSQYSFTGNSVNKKYSLEFDTLKEDTTYYYSINASSATYFDEVGSLVQYSFRTPKLVPSVLTGTLTSTGKVYLDNATQTGVIFTGGTASGKIVLSNTGTNVSVEIPTYSLRISASGSWDGFLDIPVTYTGSNTITSTDGTFTANRIELIGSSIASLILSGQVATVTLPMTAQSGSTVRVYRADAVGQFFTYIATCTITNNLCSFTTDHFSAFALSSPVPPVISSGGGSSGGGSSSISSGPGGGTYSTYGIFSTSYLYPTPKISIDQTGSKALTSNTSTPKKITLSYFNRTKTLDQIEKSIEMDGISKTAEIIRSEVEKNPSRIGKILSYDIIINYIGSRIREEGGNTDLSGVQKKLSGYRSEIIFGKR